MERAFSRRYRNTGNNIIAAAARRRSQRHQPVPEPAERVSAILQEVVWDSKIASELQNDDGCLLGLQL